MGNRASELGHPPPPPHDCHCTTLLFPDGISVNLFLFLPLQREEGLPRCVAEKEKGKINLLRESRISTFGDGEFPGKKREKYNKNCDKNPSSSRAHVGNRDGPKKTFSLFYKGTPAPSQRKGEGWLSKIESDKRNLLSRVQSTVKRGESKVCAKNTKRLAWHFKKTRLFLYLPPPSAHKKFYLSQNNNKKP